MAIPATPKELMDRAMDEAWTAAEKSSEMLETNNYSGATVWAQTSMAWSSIVSAAAGRLNP